MRIALDARHAGRGLGISTFITHLARELVLLEPAHEIVWLGDPASAPAGIASTVRADRPPYPALDGPLGRALIRRLGIDVVHFTSNTGWGRRGPAPYVLTIHDLIFMTSATGRRSLRQLVGHAYERRLIDAALAVADVVAVPSIVVAEQLIDRFGAAITPHVIHQGVDAVASPALAAAGSPLRHGRPYVVAFAGRDPRKRTVDVVEAWRALPAGTADLTLLASGGLPPGLRESLAQDLERGTVEILVQIPREELWRLLAGALALAYPSADEGFGLPVLEAMAAGTPVLTGVAPVTREVGGDAIIALDPADVRGSLGAALWRLHQDPRLRAEFVRRGRERAAAFTWERTAERYLELYQAAIAGGR